MSREGGEFEEYQWVADATRSKRNFYSPSTVGDINRLSKKLERDIREKKVHPVDAFSDAVALVTAACERFLQISPNDTQVSAAYALSLGNIVELPTGEGKTIVAMMAAYLHTLRGEHVDICTTNDYLAERDYRWMALVYGALGISSGLILSRTPRHERREQYTKHITYAANQELAFDHLRDHLSIDPADQVLGSLQFAIIDEVDSVLIDEARTPLIISERGAAKMDTHEASDIKMCVDVVRSLIPERDYEVDLRAKSAVLTERGIETVTKKIGKDLFSDENSSLFRYLEAALFVHVFFKNGKDYIIQNGKLKLVDEFTGHILEDRKYIDGIQQVLEAHEGIVPTQEDVITASITYRNFFCLYSAISGMTGTAYIARREFETLYHIDVVRFPPNKGLRRVDYTTRFFRSDEEKLAAIVAYTQKQRAEGTPLLIVGRSVSLAEKVSKYLSEKNVPHQLLHAGREAEESNIIKRAGEVGMVTVATNMAGRGADIVIDRVLQERSGLRMLGIEHNFSRRVDNQLRGRAGRQGQKGETEFFASLEDELLQTYGDDAFWDAAEAIEWKPEGIYHQDLDSGVDRAQEAAERMEAEMRLSLARFDAVIDEHRRETYRLRDVILMTPAFFPLLFQELRHILLKEEFSSLPEREIRELLEWGLLSEEGRTLFEKCLFENEAILAASLESKVPNKNEVRKSILTFLDTRWQAYLANTRWLEDWIPFVGVGGEDPFVTFIADAHKMFHDMRKDFALETLRMLRTIIR